MANKIDAKEYLKILNAENCKIIDVAKRLKCTKQYASILMRRLGVEIQKTAVLKRVDKSPNRKKVNG